MKSKFHLIPSEAWPQGYLSTATLAERMDCLPASIRTSLWRNGHYYGIKPVKLPGGKSSRLLWPADSVQRILSACKEAA